MSARGVHECNLALFRFIPTAEVIHCDDKVNLQQAVEAHDAGEADPGKWPKGIGMCNQLL